MQAQNSISGGLGVAEARSSGRGNIIASLGSRAPLIALFPLTAVLLLLGGTSSDSTPEVRYPDPDAGVDLLAARAKAQLDTAEQFKVFYQFHFTDELKKSRITFVQKMVDDAGIDYKPVHYDHGTGIAVADVDGVGLYDI